MYLGVQYCQIVHYIHFRTLTKQYVATIFSMFFSCGSLHPKSDTIGKQKESQITIETCSTTSWKNSSVNLNHCSNHFRIHSSQRFQSSPLWLREDSLWEVEVSLESQRPRPQRPRPHPQNQSKYHQQIHGVPQSLQACHPRCLYKAELPRWKIFQKAPKPMGKNNAGNSMKIFQHHEIRLLVDPNQKYHLWPMTMCLSLQTPLLSGIVQGKISRVPRSLAPIKKDHLRRKSYISQYLLTYWLKMKIGVPWKLMVGR